MEEVWKPKNIWTMGPKISQNISGWKNIIGLFMTVPGDNKDDLTQYTRTDIAQSLADALEEAKSVIASINSGKQHKVELEDDVAYWQRGEWCEWAKNDVFPKIEAALANYRKGES